MWTRRGRDANGGDGPSGSRPTPAPGKRTLTEALGEVQYKTDAAGPGEAAAPASRTPTSKEDVATLAIEHKGPGRPVDPDVRAKVEPHVGADLSGALVHDDPLAREATTAMGARAFAFGRDVFVGQGERATDLGLMAHELTHVVQQGAAGTATTQRKVAVGDANSPAEAQADAVAARVTGGAVPSALLVDAGPVGDGQMLKSVFIARLRGEVDGLLRSELGALGAALSSPVIDRYFGRYGGGSAAAGEATIRRFVPVAAHSAEQMLPAIVARLRSAIHEWRTTGEAPADLPVEEAAANAGMVAAPPGTAAAMVAELGHGQRLDGAVAQRMADGFGASFDDVVVHTGPEAARKAGQVGATALTVGTHIGFAQGMFTPGTATGDALLAHELAHVEQQRDAGPRAMLAPLGDESADAEADADRATGGALLQLLARKTREKQSVMKTGLQLQRCPGPPKQAITDPFVLGLQAKLAAGDKAGMFADLVGLNRSRAGNAALRDGIKLFQTNGQLTVGEALRALVIVELGPNGTGATAWPVAVRNWVDGVNDGVFAVTLASVPVGRDPLQELAIVTAGGMANGPGIRGEFQALFDAKWTTAAETTDFDPTLPSKGPRNKRAHRIFDELYREARFKTGYDTDAPAGFRNFCDTYAGPTSLNIVASPRLETFRAGFAGASIAAATTADPAYTTLVAAITPLLAKLDAGDHAVLESEPQRWQTLYEGKLHGSAPGVIRDFLAVVSGAAPAAPRAPSPLSAPPPVVAPLAPPPPGSPPPPPGTPAPPTAAEQAWLNSITIAGPGAAVNVEERSTDIDFNIRSTTPNPSLVVEREVSVTPAAQTMSGTDHSREVWPVGSKLQPHTATIDPTTAAPTGITNVVAELTMPPHGAHFAAKKSAPVAVHDKRIDMVKRDVKSGLSFNEFQRYVNPATPALTYYGGQLTVRVDPFLPAANPGLNLFVSADINKGGAAVPGGTFAAQPFRAGTSWFRLGELLLQQAPGGAAGAKDTFELSMRYQIGPTGAPFHSPPPSVFHVHHGALHAAPTAADTALLHRDKTELDKPGAAVAPAGNARSTVLEFLKFPPATLNADQQANCKRVAAAVTAGAVPLLPMFIRSDSAAQVTAAGGDPATQVAYALGSLIPADLMIERPGWAGWQAWRGPAIYINRTPDPLKLGSTRSIEEMAMFAAHEAIHSVDDPPPGWMAGTPDAFYRYRMEFRAYWVDGRFSNQSTDRDDSLTFGPKSPRANAIFQHIYSSYDYTKQGYDSDASDFRSKVDNYLYPDGINLIASAQLAALKTAVRNPAGAFAVRHARVSAALGACNATDKAEITGNRAWRDDIEANFGTAPEPVPGAAPPRNEPARDQIKRLLGIPM